MQIERQLKDSYPKCLVIDDRLDRRFMVLFIAIGI